VPQRSTYRKLEHVFDLAFGAAANPLKQLGALAFLLFWLLAITGIVLYIVLDTSAHGAHRSIDELSRDPWSFGSAVRGLHRYGADAFILVALAHLAREWVLGRFRGFRSYSWLTGVPLLPLAFVCAVGGFWLNWDTLGQFSAEATAEWLDALPLLATPLARNFLDGGVGDRLFSLLVFVHLGVPLLLVFGLWFHIQRISRAVVFPRSTLAWGTMFTLLALALIVPVRSGAAAELTLAPGALSFDWILLFMHPLAEVTSNAFVWIVLVTTLVALFALPLLGGGVRRPVAQVDPLNCNGCRRCAEDCPFGAVTMVPHPGGRRGSELAQVRARLCAGCGICVGACPSAAPGRKSQRLSAGVEIPSLPVDELRTRLRRGLDAMAAGPRLVVFGCHGGAPVRSLAAPDVLPLSLECTGMLPPSFVEYALRSGADGVLVVGCREGACDFRLGQRWAAERLSHRREPSLRSSVPAKRWKAVWADAGDEGAVQAALGNLRRGTAPAIARTAEEHLA
jgi:coenzyme F420-reducing hydrogenase delta subunit/ferredoxin